MWPKTSLRFLSEKSLEARSPGNKKGKPVCKPANYLPTAGLFATGLSQASKQNNP
jgi:hypothetical protein